MIKWINHSKGDTPDNRGHYESTEKRFEIHPRYRSTIYPSSYEITDYMGKRDGNSYTPVSVDFDSIRDCKAWALRQIGK